MFRLLAAVPGGGEAEAVDLAFQSVQLTCGDYLAAMPFPRLKRCLQVAVLYCRQQADVNVALTTISLLWNAADLFGKAAGMPVRRHSSEPPGAARAGAAAGGAAAEDDGSDTEVEAAVALPLPAEAEAEEEDSGSEGGASPAAKRSQLAASLTPAQTEELLQMIFLALQVGGVGGRGAGGTSSCCSGAAACLGAVPDRLHMEPPPLPRCCVILMRPCFPHSPNPPPFPAAPRRASAKTSGPRCATAACARCLRWW